MPTHKRKRRTSRVGRPLHAVVPQREWLRVALASISDAFITTDTQGRVNFLNPEAQSLTGWTQEDAQGLPLERVFNIINEATRQAVENPASRALREGQVVGLANHTLLIAKDSTERPIDHSVAPMRTAKGEVTGVVLVFRDSTDRRRREGIVRDALTYAENIIATLREPFIVLDDNLRVRTANRAFYQSFHALPEQTENQYIYNLGNQQWDIPALRVLLEAVIRNDHPIHDYEVEHDFPAIGRRIMRLNASPVLESGHDSHLILLAIEDITERRQVSTAVAVSETRYRRLFETAQDAILIVDAVTGRIQDANPFIEQTLGYRQDELVGKELWEIGFFQDIAASRMAFEELQQKGYIRYDHLPLATKSGKRVEVEFVSNVYQVDQQQVAQCNIRDITERTRLEHQAQEQAQALADLNRRKDEFLAMLSHELRNPLAPILNAVHLLRHVEGEDPIRRQARTIIERQAGQLARLVDDLLEVSRIATGKIRLNEERLELRRIVELAVETVHPLIKGREHDLSVSLPAQPIWVYADAARLEQVVVNLLNNAAKYTDPRGHIWLTLQQEGDDAVLRVRDSGIGMTPETLPYIFDLFTQAPRSIDRAQGGLGIGLTLTRRLLEMHRGRVEAYSAGLGQGSEFTARLPVLLSVPERRQTPPISPVEPRARFRRILVVDDNADLATTTTILLRLAGHKVAMAHDGPSALAAAVDFHPHVVLLDLGLPGMDGYEVARRFRQDPGLARVRLIALTGYGQQLDRQRSEAAGFDHHLVKPAAPEQLEELLR